MVLSLPEVRYGEAEARFNSLRQTDSQRVEPLAGGQDLLHLRQRAPALIGEDRLTSAAIEQLKAEIVLQPGDRRADS